MGWLLFRMLDKKFKHTTLFTFDQNETISDKNSILNMQRGITKWTQINLSWTDITVMLVKSTAKQDTVCKHEPPGYCNKMFPATFVATKPGILNQNMMISLMLSVLCA